MKSRDLFTIHDLIASNYVITKQPSGKYLHQFTPATTGTVYQFEANGTAAILEGERYNIGYTVDAAGNNIIDVSALSVTSQVNPQISYLAAKQLSQGIYETEKAKNNERVTHAGKDGYYWGKKYAWRMYGQAIAQDAFISYLNEIGHPSVSCQTQDPDKPFNNTTSTAYLDDGLDEAMYKLIMSATPATPARYKSPLYSRQFIIKGINAITDKK